MTFEELQAKYPIGQTVEVLYPKGEAVVKDHVMNMQDWNTGSYDMNHITYIASEMEMGGDVGCLEEVQSNALHVWHDGAGQDLLIPLGYIKGEDQVE